MNTLRSSRPGQQTIDNPSGPYLTTIGAVSGFGSALTGTGGPLMLVPLLVWLEMPILMAIGLSQAIQFPIASLATAGNLVYGRLDILLGSIIAMAVAGGTLLGARLAHILSQQFLRRAVAWLLIVVGLAMEMKNLYSWAVV